MAKRTKRRRVVVDTDVGPDDLLAIQSLFLSLHDGNVQKNNVPWMSTVNGMTTPSRGAQYLTQLFQNTLVFTGSHVDESTPSPPWLKSIRQNLSDIMTTITHSFPSKMNQNDDIHMPIQMKEKDAVLEIRNTFASLPQRENKNESENIDDKVDIICLGPLTNLAYWLESEFLSSSPENGIDKIGNIFIMGGNLPVLLTDEDSKVKPEFNFKQDPQAVATVLSNLSIQSNIHLITVDVSSPSSLSSLNLDAKIQNILQNNNNNNDEPPLGVMSTLISKEPSSVYYDTICMYSYILSLLENSDKHEKTSLSPMVQWKKIKIQIDSNSGLLTTAPTRRSPFTANSNRQIDYKGGNLVSAEIKFATNILNDVDSANDYITWIKSNIEKEITFHKNKHS